MAEKIDRIRVWASTGLRTKPADAEIDSGWVPGEQPPAEWENERMYTRDTALAELTDAANSSVSGARQLFEGNIASGIPKKIGFLREDFSDNKWHVNPITLDRGAMYDATLYIHEGEKRLVFIWDDYVTVDKTIKVATLSGDSVTSHAWPGDIVVALCSTGQYIYIIYADLVAGNYEYRLTAVDGLTWATKPGWATTDPLLGKEAFADIDDRPFCCVTGAGNILCGGRWYGVAGDDKLVVVNADTGIVVESGDAGLAGDRFPSGRGVVCRGYVYYTALDTSGNEYIHVVDETDLSVIGHSGSPLSYGALAVPEKYISLATMGDYYVVGHDNGTQLAFSFFKGGTFSNTFFGSFYINYDSLGYTGDMSIGSMVFDGVKLWCALQVDSEEMLVEIPIHSIRYVNISIDPLDASFRNRNLIDTGHSSNMARQKPGLLFDGSDVHYSPFGDDLDYSCGYWHRLRNVHNR